MLPGNQCTTVVVVASLENRRMSFLIQKGKPLLKQYRAVLLERIQKAMEDLQSYGPEYPQGLHSARKNLKRCRSVLKLLRGKELRRERQELDAAIRKIALGLSINRDREVLVALLDEWRDPEAGAVLEEACSILVTYLCQDRQEVAAIDPKIRDNALERCLKVRRAIRRADFSGLRRKVLRNGAEAAYRKVQLAFFRYRENPEPEAFHDLRKCAKHHLYHRQVLRDCLDLKEARTRRVREFEGLLGKVRDCDLVLETVANHWDCGLAPEHVAALVIKAETEKECLLADAMKKAGRFLAVRQSAVLSR